MRAGRLQGSLPLPHPAATMGTTGGGCLLAGGLPVLTATAPRPWSPLVRETERSRATVSSPDAGPEPAPAPDRLWCMSEVDIFTDLDESDMATIAAAAPMRRFAAGELVHAPEQHSETLYILKQGRVRIFRLSGDGRALTTAILSPGTVFGEMVLVGQSMHDSYAEALDDVTVCVMSRSDVRRLLLADPRVAARISEILGRRLAALEQRLSDTVFKSVPQRVGETLLTLASQRSLGRAPVVQVTHEQLAALVGTSRETTTKVLGELAARGVVGLGRGRITVLDPDALRAPWPDGSTG